MALKNPWGKMRPKDKPYVTLADYRCAFTYHVMKCWSDPRKPYARAFCWVVSPDTGPSGDMGDCYAKDIPGLIDAWCHAAMGPLRADTRSDSDLPRAAANKGD